MKFFYNIHYYSTASQASNFNPAPYSPLRECKKCQVKQDFWICKDRILKI